MNAFYLYQMRCPSLFGYVYIRCSKTLYILVRQTIYASATDCIVCEANIYICVNWSLWGRCGDGITTERTGKH